MESSYAGLFYTCTISVSVMQIQLRHTIWEHHHTINITFEVVCTTHAVISTIIRTNLQVSSMECDVANDKSVEESLEQSRNRLQTVTRDVYLSLSSATCKKGRTLLY